MQTSSVRRLRWPLAIALAAIVLGAAAAFAAVQIGGGLPAAANQGVGGDTSQGAALEAQDIEQEMKQLALAMLMYLQDADGRFPPTDDIKEIQALLGPYMARQDIFRRDLRYVMPPGVSVGSIEMPHFTPLAIVDHEAALQVVAYVDGHTEVKRRQEEGSASERIIELTIVHENGAPARGAKIRMLGDGLKATLVADDRGHRKGVITNAGGEASFYIQSADGREHSLATVLFAAAGGGREAKRVILHPWGTAAGTVSFSGQVVDQRGRPVEGASIWAYGFESMGPPAERGVGPVFLSRELGQTGADGGFSAKIPRLPSGCAGWGGGWIEPWTCQLMAHRPGHGVGWAEADGDSVIAGVEIRLSEPGGLRGKVFDADGQLLPKVSVRLSELRVPETPGKPAKTLVFGPGASVPLWAERRTDERGEFTFADLPAEAAVKLSGSTCGAEESYRKDQQFPDLGEIKLAEQRGDIVIKLVGTPIIEGVLLTPDPEREPASNVKVRLAGPSRDDPHSIFSGRAVTDEEGRYEFRLPEAGSYTLWVADVRHFAVIARDLQIEPGRRITLPAAVLQRTGSIRGRALDAVTGEPIPGVRVDCEPRTETLPFPVVTTESGATAGPDGSFVVGGPPGEVLLRASGPPSGYTWNHSVTKETVNGKTLVRVTEDEEKPTRRLLQVESGGTLTGVDLFFTPEARLQGIVLGPEGQPWRRAGYVHGHLDPEFVRSHSHPPIGDRVGPDGRFSSRYLYPEVPVVFLMVDPERGLGGGVRVTPTRAKPTEITIHLKPMVRVVGRVLKPDGTPAAGVDIRPTRSPSVTTTSGEDGRFEVIGGIVGLPCTVRAYVLRPREQRQLLGWYEFIGASQAHEVSSGQRVVDIGDIVLEPYEQPKVE